MNVAQTEFIKTFEIVIQFGAISSIIFLYFHRGFKNTKVLANIVAAFIPTAAAGFLFYKVIKNIFFENIHFTVWALLLGGIVLIFLEKILPQKGNRLSLENLSLKKSFLIGLFQSVSVIPGVSRAAASIVGGLVFGLNRTDSLEFSFLLAVPTIFAASAYDLYQQGFSFSQNEIVLLLTGFIGAFLASLLSVKFFLSFVRRNSLAVFGVYRIILAVLLFLIF